MALPLSRAVADLINQQEWPIQFEAVRRLFPVRDPAEIATTQVSVFDGPRTSERGTRGE